MYGCLLVFVVFNKHGTWLPDPRAALAFFLFTPSHRYIASFREIEKKLRSGALPLPFSLFSGIVFVHAIARSALYSFELLSHLSSFSLKFCATSRFPWRAQVM